MENTLRSLMMMSFNPCSVGSCSGSRVALPFWLIDKCFNPCSVGSCSGSEQRWAAQEAGRRFQSLFCWIMLGEQYSCLNHWAYIRFNPCSVGSCSGRIIEWIQFYQWSSFNPCSVGSCSGSTRALLKTLNTYSFNPCSVGSCSGSDLDDLRWMTDGMFQSLFCWIMLGEIVSIITGFWC